MREHNGASRYAPIVIGDESGGAGENRGNRQNDTPHGMASHADVLPQRPPEKGRAKGDKKNSPFGGPAHRQNACPQTENNRVSKALVIPDSRQGSQDQGSRGRRHRSSPITIHPV